MLDSRLHTVQKVPNVTLLTALKKLSDTPPLWTKIIRMPLESCLRQTLSAASSDSLRFGGREEIGDCQKEIMRSVGSIGDRCQIAKTILHEYPLVDPPVHPPLAL